MPREIATTHSEQETLALAARWRPSINRYSTVGLIGQLGAGKTTFVRGLLQAFGYKGHVKSPTYGLVETYTTAARDIAHFDLYRLADPDELEFIGFRDYLGGDSLCLIEWPEKGGRWTRALDLCVEIEALGAERQFRLSTGTT